MLETVKKLIADELNIDEKDINENSRLKEDLNVDSLDVVELVMRLEEEFNISVSDEVASKLTTVSDIVNFVKEQSA